jgi:hypothetical protein
MPKSLRFIFIILLSVLIFWNAVERDWVGAVMLSVTLILNIAFYVIDEIKEYIDQKL